MRDDPEQILKVAVSVADGRDVDWEKERASVLEAEDRALLEQLRAVERLASAQRGPEPLVPDHWGGLQIRALIGRGAFGCVYRAFDPRLDREVALKLLAARADLDERKVIDEGRMLARVRHPNVATVFGADVHDGCVGIWMELIQGRTLDTVLRDQGRMSATEAAAIGVELCRALAAVHQAGLIHRDIKARNVVREEGGRLVLMDFGSGGEPIAARGSDEGERVESGTPIYMAPEVMLGGPSTAAADLYGLGVLLYHLVTGDYPVRGASVAELRQAHAQGRRTPLRDARPDLPDAFLKVVEQALDSDPARRPPSAGAMERALALSGAHAPGRSARRAWIVAAAVLLVMGSAGTALLLSRRAPIPSESAPGLSADDFRTVTSLNNLAALYAAMGAYDRAAPLYERSLSIQQRSLGDDSPDVSATLAALGFSLDESGAVQRAQSIKARAASHSVPPETPAPGAASLAALGGRRDLTAARYTVEASLYRKEDSGARRLAPEDSLSAADKVYLEFQSTMPAFVYVLNEDDRGESFLLFPLRGSDLANPLPAGKPIALPGKLEGRQVYWQVTSAGGHERFLVIASLTRLAELEEELALMERPREGRPVIASRVSDAGALRLRGLGGLAVEGDERHAPTRAPGRIFELARRLTSGPEAAQGVWIRQVELSNPAD